MRAAYRMFVALALAAAIGVWLLPGHVLAQGAPPTAAAMEGAAGLRVVAVRERTEPAGIELVFADRSAEALKQFSTRAAGHDVDFFVNGEKVATLKLRDPIVGNSVMLTGQFSGDFKKSLQRANLDVDIKLHR